MTETELREELEEQKRELLARAVTALERIADSLERLALCEQDGVFDIRSGPDRTGRPG